jgi:transcriptional regulator with XRE-family HTH domain
MRTAVQICKRVGEKKRMAFGVRLREERERLGLSQAALGDLVGAAKRTVVEWEKDTTSPTGHALERLASHGMDVSYVVTGKRSGGGFWPAQAPQLSTGGAENLIVREPSPQALDMVEVPRLEIRVSAGNGARSRLEVGQSRGVMAFRRDWMRQHLGRSSAGFATVLVAGDSMSPSLSDGDEVVVDTESVQGLRRDGIYVIRLGDDLRIKRLRLRVDGSLEVWGDNPAYQAEQLSPEQAAELQVVGRVVWPRLR